MISRVTTIDEDGWTDGPVSDSPRYEEALESGDVLFAPRLAFQIKSAELHLFSSSIAAASKNVSFDPVSRRLGGTSLNGDDRSALQSLISRFSDESAALVRRLVPVYGDAMMVGRASFRPIEIAGRASSWRKDDTRLHVDSFPATPVRGRRILRVFTNVNPHGRPRSWRIGEDFESMSRRFAAALRVPLPGSGALLRLLRITKSTRSPYDALMLQLHDRMKADTSYQSSVPQTSVDFPAGSTWMAFTDQVSHAAIAGQFQLEQTFLIPLHAMIDERRSPLRILEQLISRRLA